MSKRAILSVFICIIFVLVPAFAQSGDLDVVPETVQSDSLTIDHAPAQSEDSGSESAEVDSEETDNLPDATADGEPSSTEPALALREEAEEEEQFDVELDGRKTWTIRYGFGSPLGLATSGLSPGQLTLDQSLTVDLVGEALSILTIEAHYNDQQSQTLQNLALRLDTERLDGVLGDFTFGSMPGFSAYSKKLKGLQLEYLIGDAVLTAVISKTEGVSKTAVFVGQAAHAEIEYGFYLDSEFEDPAPYRTNLDGLASYRLKSLYTDEFSSVYAHFSVDPGLRGVLNLYEIGYLYDAVTAAPQLEFKTQNFRVLELDEQVLVLQRDPLLLVREWLKELIDIYNDQISSEDSELKSYPFTTGTDYEWDFLRAVAPFADVIIDGIAYPIDEAQQREFYNLGHEDIRENSVVVQISTDGVTFNSLPSSRFPDYEFTVHAADGVLECHFPDSFYTAASRLRVEMDYVVSDGAFMLGLSMIPDSERVTLNSSLLQRDVDYMIDYELGMLFMLIELEETDVLQVDYEIYSGGFGAASDYASYFYGLTLDLPISDRLTLQANLLQLADVAGSVADTESVRTMPNRHTIFGVQADLSLDEFTAHALVGYNVDRFPFDDNARVAGTNQINAIAAGDGYVLFGHQAGVTVYDAGSWQTYGLQSGLSSQVVQAAAMGDDVAFLGTDAGLTIVRLDGASPFDRAANWMRYFESDGLPDASVTAIIFHDGLAWIGTRGGLLSMPIEGSDPSDNWVQLKSESLEPLPPITSLAADDDFVYVGTENGVYVYAAHVDTLELVEGTEGVWVNDLVLANATLYVASKRGLRGFRNGTGMGWLVLGESISCLAYADGTLYYGTGAGVVALGDAGTSTLLDGVSVTAMGVANGRIWVGSEASETYEMTVWQLAKGVKAFPESTTGIPGVDPYAFADSLASQHTVTGWLTRASFRQNTDSYSLSGTVEAVPPTFRPIGSLRRSDSTGWTLSGDTSLGSQGTLRADHEYRLSDQSGDRPRDRMTNSISVDWDYADGPDWQATVRQEESNETDSLGDNNTRKITMSVLARESFFRDSLQLAASWDRINFSADRWDEAWQRESISLSVDWQLTQALATNSSWSRPVRFADGEISGSERLDWDWDWSTSIGFADVDVEVSSDWARALSKDMGNWSHHAEVRFDGDAFQRHGWDFTPNLKLEGAHDDTDTDLHAEFVLRSKMEDFSLRSTIRGHLTELGRPVFNREGELSLNAKYSGFSDVDLSITYSGSRSAAVMADDIAPASSDSLTGRMVWSPEEGPRDELSFSLRIKGTDITRQITASIDNGLTLNLAPVLTDWLRANEIMLEDGYPISDLRLDSKAEYRGGTSNPELSFSTSARVLVALAPSWNVSFATTYQMGHKMTIGFYNSLALELTFAIEF